MEHLLEYQVVHGLMQRKTWLATAESCTGGLVAKRITDIPGASAVFPGGLVTYANEAKTRLLGVPESLLQQHGAVSEACARAMAEGVCGVFPVGEGASIMGISITGVAGPDGGTPEKPVGLVYVALSHRGQTEVRVIPPTGKPRDRAWLRQRAADAALEMILEHLQRM